MKVSTDMINRYSENHLKFAFAINLSITRTAKYPDAKADNAPTATQNQFICASAPACATSITLNSNEPSMMGMLIKNEKVATSLLSAPATVPPKIVEPDREMPGNTPAPCITPIAIALPQPRGLGFLLRFATISLTSIITAVNRKKKHRYFAVEKYSSI